MPFISLNAKLHKNDIILSSGDGCEPCFSHVNHKEFKEVNGIAVTKISISIYLNLQTQSSRFISIKETWSKADIQPLLLPGRDRGPETHD